MVPVSLICNGALGRACLKALIRHGAFSVVSVVSITGHDNEHIVRICSERGIPHLESDSPNSTDSFNLLTTSHPEHLFNINSRVVLNSEIIRTARLSVLNFHNGPLPTYRGVNVCSWAIVNEEVEYGICWHTIEAGQSVDSGTVVAFGSVAIGARETAGTLLAKCSLVGLEQFPSVMDWILRPSGTSGKGSELGKRGEGTLYRRSQRPFDGKLPLHLGWMVLDRVIRGTNFHPFENDFYWPSVSIQGATYSVLRAELKQRNDSSYLEDAEIFIGGEIVIPVDGADLFLLELSRAE